MNTLTFDLRRVKFADIRPLFEAHHGYGGAGGVAVYAFAVFERERIVAAFAWQPPPPGAAKSVCPEMPSAVLSLSRMVAVPRAERALKHISKPLRAQMRHLIDRTRWPVLVTYSDEGQGHTGYVYQCSGWTPTKRPRTPVFSSETGARVSTYRNGAHDPTRVRTGYTHIQRWEHWACPRDSVRAHMQAAGWCQVPQTRPERGALTWVRHSS